MKIKTSELEGVALDWVVAETLGHKIILRGKKRAEIWLPGIPRYVPCPGYSTDWAHGGPIIEREKISVKAQQPDWAAYIAICDGLTDRMLFGPTPLIAAMRCYVASKLGDEVEIPEELT